MKENIIPILKKYQLEELEKNLTLFYTLKELGGNVNTFFEKINQKENNFFSNKEYIISIDTSDKKVKEMRYEKDKNWLNIFLKVEKGEIKKKDIVLKSPFLSTSDVIPQTKIKLLARVLNKIDFNKEKELYITSLTLNDFYLSGASQKDLKFILKELTINTWQLPSLLFLWEKHSSPILIKGIFYSQKEEQLKKFLENYKGEQKGKGILFTCPEKDFKSIKEKILNFL